MNSSLDKAIAFAYGTVTRRLYLHAAIVAVFLLIVVSITIWAGNTLTMITAFTRFERTHTVSRVEAMAAFYEYLDQKKPESLELFHAKLAVTQSYNKVFSRLLEMRKDTPDAAYVHTLESTFSEIDHETAVIIVNRIKVLYWNPILRGLVANAIQANAAGEKLKKQVAQFLATNNQVGQAAILARIHKTNTEFIAYENSFSESCSALSNQIASYVNFITIALLITSAGFIGLLSYLIANAVIQQTRMLNEAEEIANLGFYAFDIEKDSWTSSAVLDRIFGIDQNFPRTSMSWLSIVAPPMRDEMKGYLTELLNTKGSFDRVFQIQRIADGELRWVQGYGKFILSRDGKPIQLAGSIADITERRQMERDQKESDATFRRLFEDSSDAILLIDSTGVFVECNQAALNLLKMTRKQFLLLPPARISTEFQPDGRRSEESAPEMIALAYSKGLHRFDWTCVNSEGGEFIVEVSLMPISIKGQTMLHTTWRDITARKNAENEINSLAFYDPLTDLPNRRMLFDRLKHCQVSSSLSEKYGALLLIDLDNFKSLNDTNGHDIGDMLLQQVAQRLVTCARADDTVARLGGDEFILILADLSVNRDEAATQVEGVARKIFDSLNTTYQLGNIGHRGTASMGATLFLGNHTSVDELLKQADLAMYKSKEAGRNTLRFFDPVMQTIVLQRAALEMALRTAFDKHQFLLHYQAQVLGEGRVTGVEVLLRWQHPERGMISPLDFIPLAEETGLIIPLGNWVLETACVELHGWSSQPDLAHLTVAVNVSAKQIREPDFIDTVLAIIRKTGANPHRLKLELTESLLVDNVEDIIEKMSALKVRGIGFSLDDFGTGYSSLSYLKRLPLDQLKIDQSFVRDALIDPNDAAIARTIVALAEALGLSVIAEGVETKAQKDLLAKQGCHAYQGYLFSRPLPLKEFERFVRQT